MHFPYRENRDGFRVLKQIGLRSFIYRISLKGFARVSQGGGEGEYFIYPISTHPHPHPLMVAKEMY
jgi:hypothetical protein